MVTDCRLSGTNVQRMSSVGLGHSSRTCNLDPSLPDGTHSGTAILSTLTSVTLLRVCVYSLNERVCTCACLYECDTTSLSSYASLFEAQAIWCPLSEIFYLACFEMPFVGGQGQVKATQILMWRKSLFIHNINNSNLIHLVKLQLAFRVG